jgi:eukaryotic-like serine/threonine-protein kinase
MPMIDLSRWPDADALLDEALGLPAHARPLWLASIAERDEQLAAALGRVLREETPDTFLVPGGALHGALGADMAATGELTGSHVPRLPEGSQFGPYRVAGLLGRGGMGEVYRARDVRLERDVALKVLPDRWAADPGRRARLEREARVLASLRHTSIAAIYHLEEHEGVTALVLEAVEGPTLAEHLAEGPRDWRTAISIARDLVDALDAAHQRAVVHRDLKPANIKLPPEGGLKVLDFGLARAFSAETDSDVGDGLTTIDGRTGQVLGTAAYMSPEQAMGRRVDARTDVWAFGCVFYEMLTGRRAFEGSSTQEVLAAVLAREVDLSHLPADTPDPLRRLLRRCLQKDPRKRLGYIGDVHLELDEASGAGTEPAPVAPVPARPAWTPRHAGMLGVGALLALGASGVWWSPRATAPAPPAPRALHLALPVVDGERFVSSFVPVVALSPDGSAAVYRAERDGVTQLYVRNLDGLASIPLPGSENATGPFFSPDLRWLAFDRDGVLMKVSFAGGPAIRICDAPGGVTAVWAEDDTIYFSAGTRRNIQRVSASGGAPTPVTDVRTTEGEISHATPALLPGGRSLLFTIFRTDGARIARLDLDSGVITPLLDGKQPYYLPSGHLVFAREGALWVVEFDGARGLVTGDPLPAVNAVLDAGGLNGGAQFALSPTGALLYAPAHQATSARVLLWFDRSGNQSELPLEPRAISRLSLSPDGTRAALSIGGGPGQDIWIYDLQRVTLTRVTTHPEVDTAPVWSPDGRTLAFRSHRDGGGLFLQRVDPPGEARRLTAPNGPIHTPYAFTPDGRAVLFTEFRSYPDQDIGMVEVDTGEVTWLLTDPAAEMRPRLSPDGRWLTYSSNESGRFEVYVRPFPDVHARRWQISSGGGTSPQWSPDGRELWFDDGNALNVVNVSFAHDTFEASRPRALMPATGMYRDRLGPSYEIAPDGKRILTFSVNRQPRENPTPLMILEGWLPRGGVVRAR